MEDLPTEDAPIRGGAGVIDANTNTSEGRLRVGKARRCGKGLEGLGIGTFRRLGSTLN